jgi:predicted MFS family arabinose efflux permease
MLDFGAPGRRFAPEWIGKSRAFHETAAGTDPIFSIGKLFSWASRRATLPRVENNTLRPRRGYALGVTAIAYVPAVISMMTIGVLVPFITALGRDLSASPAALGLAIALFSLPTAVLATLGGGLIDRFGLRRSMLIASAASVLASVFASLSSSLLALDCAMLLSGVGFGGLCVGAPSLIIRTLDGGPRIRAMSFLSTFAPTGYAAGLLLAVPFVDSGNWQAALRIHAAIMAVMLVVMLRYLPQPSGGANGERKPARQTITQMLSVMREPRALRLGVAVALPNALSYGTSLVAPSYLARVHEVSLATSSATVAFAKLAAMIIGGLSTGYLLSRAVNTSLLFGIMAGIGALAQVVLFLPASGITVATAALILWLFAFGGMAGGAMTLLPSVVRDPAQSGAASGLVNQFISAASFAAPSTWLALQEGVHFMALAGACLAISLIALPGVPRLSVTQRAEETQ